MLIADAHLDLAYNALHGREVLLPATQQTPGNIEEDGIPSVGLPDLRRGGVGLICATIFCEPDTGKPNNTGYKTTAEAHTEARRQLAWYQEQFAAGELRLVRSKAEVPAPSGVEVPAPSRVEVPYAAEKSIATIILMEGGDPLGTEADVDYFFSRGMRIVGLAWKRTRHAGGTGHPGPLTDEGRAMVRLLDQRGIIHDASHLAEDSFWEFLKLSDGPIIATHSNCRAFNPTDRQLSDDMIRAIVSRGGICGMNFYDKFLVPPDEFRKRPANLKDLLRHIRRVCDLAGNAEHVGIGTDMDGGFGRDEIPREIRSSADLPKVGEFLRENGFSEKEVERIMGGNWVRYFSENLP